ncbi:TIGR03668 family PPOX class F420-dependent oxidoreductase [Prauserella oleivorans]|uniref:TIGR03668 family PPOX class F420-dependent oxidoreductase n=1 Tax=Prauserella oleivorans TaxID=1478153 RepID=A0ABW5WEE3_9PSEU
MRLDEGDARQRFAQARVARLATADPAGQPHVVPVTFAVIGDEIVFAVDGKPKSTMDLRRLRNIEANPKVAFLVDHYDDDWAQLWWVRADGEAVIHDDGPRWEEAVRALRVRYPQYVDAPPRGPAVRTAVSGWSGWAAS